MNELLSKSISKSKNNELEYDDIASYIDSSDKLSFLSDIIPKRIPFNKISNQMIQEINQLPLTKENDNHKNDNQNKNENNKQHNNDKQEMDQDDKQ